MSGASAHRRIQVECMILGVGCKYTFWGYWTYRVGKGEVGVDRRFAVDVGAGAARTTAAKSESGRASPGCPGRADRAAVSLDLVRPHGCIGPRSVTSACSSAVPRWWAGARRPSRAGDRSMRMSSVAAVGPARPGLGGWSSRTGREGGEAKWSFIRCRSPTSG
jgi:hypothetical protein